MTSVMLASGSTELARKVRLAASDDLTVIGAQQVPALPAQLLDLVPNGTQVRTVLLDVREDQVDVDQALELARRLEEHSPDVGVLLVSPGIEALGLAALRAGVKDLVDPATSVEDLRVVLRAISEGTARRGGAPGSEPPRTTGRVISVASPKGGVGKTTLATNLALALTEQSPQGTLLVDLDIQFGDVAAALDLSPSYTLADMVSGGSAADVMSLKALLTQHKSGLQVVCGVRSPVEADQISAAAIAQLLYVLKAEFRYVVIDTAPGLSEQTLAAFDNTTDQVLVTSMDVPGVRGLRKELDVLDHLDLPPATRHLVLNFADKAGGLARADVEATLNRKIDVMLPRSKKVVRATNQGIPLVTSMPRDRISREIRDLAARFAPNVAASQRFNGKHRNWGKA